MLSVHKLNELFYASGLNNPTYVTNAIGKPPHEIWSCTAIEHSDIDFPYITPTKHRKKKACMEQAVNQISLASVVQKIDHHLSALTVGKELAEEVKDYRTIKLVNDNSITTCSTIDDESFSIDETEFETYCNQHGVHTHFHVRELAIDNTKNYVYYCTGFTVGNSKLMDQVDSCSTNIYGAKMLAITQYGLMDMADELISKYKSQ